MSGVDDGGAIFLGGEDLTDEVHITTNRAEYTGTYSFIFKGTCRGEEVAVKVLKHVSDNSDTMKRKFRREVEVWTHVHHPNISPFYGYTNGSELFGPIGSLISPWYQNGDAAKFLRQRGNLITMERRIALWRGIISGVSYLHGCDPKIVHGDLKPGNILIDDNGNPRICDFGLAYIYLDEGHTELTTTSPYTGTDRYLAPELLDDGVQPSTASDVWALGCMGLYFLYSVSPYQHRLSHRNGLIFQDIRQGVLPAPQPPSTDARSKSIWQIFVGCWALLPGERLQAQDVLLLLNRVTQQPAERPSEVIRDNSTNESDSVIATFSNSDDAESPPSYWNATQNPVFLQPGPEYRGISNITLNSGGEVLAGTLGALVERLTMYINTDAKFNDAFMATFRSFATIDQVFDMLIQRYNIQPPQYLSTDQLSEWTETVRIPTQSRFLNIMRKLIGGLENEDIHILGRVKTFAQEIMLNGPESNGIAETLLYIVQRAEWNGIESKRAMHTTPSDFPPSPILPRKAGRIKLLDIDPLELARQLTIMQSEVLFNIKQGEWILHLKRLLPSGPDNIKSAITLTNKIADWVADSVLRKEDPKRRAVIIKHFIGIAEHCRHLANYSGISALITGLNSPPIRRLKRTWEQVQPHTKSILDDLGKTLDTENHFQGYKSLISISQPPCIPLLEVHLADLTFIQASEKDLLEGGLINFQKYRKAADIIQELEKFQMMAYNLSRLPTIRAFIDECLVALDTIPDFWHLSLEREKER